MTYEDLQHALRTAQDIHRLTRDPMLLSAISILTPHLSAEDPDNIELPPQAQKAYDMVLTLQEYRSLLFP